MRRSQKKTKEPFFFNLNRVMVTPLRPGNVISDEYRLRALRKKSEVIRVLGHDFRGPESWGDWIWVNLYRIYFQLNEHVHLIGNYCTV